MDTDVTEFARALIETHGQRAIQVMIDRIVPAVRAGDEPLISILDKQLQRVDALLLAASPRS